LSKKISLVLNARIPYLKKIAANKGCSIEDLIIELVDKLIDENKIFFANIEYDNHDNILITNEDCSKDILLCKGGYRGNCNNIYNQNG
jgi:hypothetical protein